jgi:O-antigen biosynthesis protein WbqP
MPLAYLKLKRLLDFVAALVLLILTAPVMLLIALLIYLDDPGKVMYTQTRAGRKHRPFIIYKFRTMYLNTPSLSTEDMQRSGLSPITRVGKWLRQTSLDELPQLWNVLVGDMSLVGPRPALLSQQVVLEGRESSGVDGLLPGITGLAQVMGRDDLDDQTKLTYDHQYLQNLTLLYDIKIMLMTVGAVFGARGVR